MQNQIQSSKRERTHILDVASRSLTVFKRRNAHADRLPVVIAAKADRTAVFQLAPLGVQLTRTLKVIDSLGKVPPIGRGPRTGVVETDASDALEGEASKGAYLSAPARAYGAASSMKIVQMDMLRARIAAQGGDRTAGGLSMLAMRSVM